MAKLTTVPLIRPTLRIRCRLKIRKDLEEIKLRKVRTRWHYLITSVAVETVTNSILSVLLYVVAIRIRPLSQRETRQEAANKNPHVGFRKKPSPVASEMDLSAWAVTSTGNTDMIAQKQPRKFESKSVFTFDKVFDETKTTAQVYEALVKPIVKGAADGRHGTVFCYGQTGSGKTYTMQGDNACEENTTGLVQMSAADLFQCIEGGSRDSLVRVSFIEIYNEHVQDLLGKGGELSLREDAKTGIGVDSHEILVENADALLKVLQCGNSNRTTAATQMNERSSRSHAIFRITVESRRRVDPADLSTEIPEVVRVSTLNFVDLAGSENGKSTKTSGIRQREGGMINQSLLSLSQVIQALSMPSEKRPPFINYRDSKLTRILQPHLSGNSLLAILCCVSPSGLYVEETRSTLRFASRAKLVHTKAVVNEVIDDTAMIRKLQKELVQTRTSLSSMEQRETAAETELREARDELKKLKEMLFGEGDLPEFENAAHVVARSRSSKYDGKSDSRTSPSTSPRKYRKSFNENEPRGEILEERMSLAKGIFRDSSPIKKILSDEQTGSTLELGVGQLRSVTRLRNRAGRADFTMTLGGSHALPSEVIILTKKPAFSNFGQSNVLAHPANEESEQRAMFLQSRLEAAENLMESLVHDVESSRSCIRQLMFKNASAATKVQKLRDKVHQLTIAKDKRHHSQYMLLKYSIYVSLFFFLFGCQELFLGCILFLWLCLEVVG